MFRDVATWIASITALASVAAASARSIDFGVERFDATEERARFALESDE
jgi:hypothetical protein